MTHLKTWIAVGALLAAAAGFASLGRWQLERAEVNRAVEAGYADAAHEPVLERPVSGDTVEAARYRRIRLHGSYLTMRQILLDNMISHGRPGYEVLTPFEPAAGEALVLVNRGWVAASPDRRILPDVALAEADTTVSGRVDHLPRAALALGGAPPRAAQGPLVVLSFPSAAEVEAALGRQVYPFQVLLDPEAADGFERDWGPPENRATRNIAYAAQWFGLCALAAVIAAGIAIRCYGPGRGEQP